MKKLKLLESQIQRLVELPETGMGYQKVKLTFKNGDVLQDMTVLNSELLVIEGNQNIDVNKVKNIELEKE